MTRSEVLSREGWADLPSILSLETNKTGIINSENLTGIRPVRRKPPPKAYRRLLVTFILLWSFY
jgi:hypothetical protein